MEIHYKCVYIYIYILCKVTFTIYIYIYIHIYRRMQRKVYTYICIYKYIYIYVYVHHQSCQEFRPCGQELGETGESTELIATLPARCDAAFRAAHSKSLGGDDSW